MFPHVHFPPGFKTPKFDKYDGHGDPVAHLKRHCNHLRGAGGKEELLMAYSGESLTGIASEWFIDQDMSHWYVWNDMAQDFVQQFQYNMDIVPDHSSLVNTKKKPTESFREYAIKWSRLLGAKVATKGMANDREINAASTQANVIQDAAGKSGRNKKRNATNKS
ncbi:uncharacterized protein [Nicotiana tomentosiformis]|uniref:uncharacterized protein n=1 Tax=Nicotiana tomentosiformis TaxID=4098 RepID=UPI00388CE2DB